MKKKNKIVTKQDLLPGLDPYFKDDGIDHDPEDRLEITLIGEGKSKADQFVDLLKRVGLSRTYRMCQNQGIWGIEKESQLLVDTKCGSRKKYYKCECEGETPYFIYVNTDTAKKKDYLARLGKALKEDRDAKQTETVIEKPAARTHRKTKVLAV